MSFKKLSMFCLAAAIVAATGCKSSDAKKTGKGVAFIPIKVGTAADDVIRMVGKPLTKTPVAGGGVKWTYENGTHVVVEGEKVIRTSGESIATTVSETVKGGEAKTGSGG